MSSFIPPNMVNPFLGIKTTNELWKTFVSRMRAIGFDNQIIFTFTYTPVRNTSGLVKEIPAIQPQSYTLLGNNLIYLGDMPYDMDEYAEYVVSNNFVIKDPVAYHARAKGTVALLGKDFLTPDMPNYQDAVDFWNQSEKYKVRNCLCVPLHQNSPWTPHGFGLHATMPGEELKEMVSKNGDRILLDCYQYTAEFNQLFRREFAEESGITKRQYEVLKLVCQGLSNTEVAGLLDISEASISFHLKALKKRLEISSTRELPLVAARLGFVDLG